MNLNEIQQALKVPKNHRNEFAKYNYRNAEDILEAVKPLLGASILTLEDEIVNVEERYYVKATASFYEESPIGKNMPDAFTERKVLGHTVTAYAREEETKKGMDGAQITGAASSYARKYALNGLFLIDDTKDADSADNTQEAPSKAVKAPPASALSKADTDTVKGLLAKLGITPKTVAEAQKAVLNATGYDFVPDNYAKIVFTLEEKIEASQK